MATKYNSNQLASSYILEAIDEAIDIDTPTFSSADFFINREVIRLNVKLDLGYGTQITLERIVSLDQIDPRPQHPAVLVQTLRQAQTRDDLPNYLLEDHNRFRYSTFEQTIGFYLPGTVEDHILYLEIKPDGEINKIDSWPEFLPEFMKKYEQRGHFTIEEVAQDAATFARLGYQRAQKAQAQKRTSQLTGESPINIDGFLSQIKKTYLN